ncbi:hypothetical protein SAY86_007044 [Trapa natans]|uniref:Uncharacterized protein n=1 Tax=Trapa natans TaxID=22666 RepID=A0AAN7LCV1_TRANT|nr:hypothetical protein SAY86_007044 [Trapa natans]
MSSILVYITGPFQLHAHLVREGIRFTCAYTSFWFILSFSHLHLCFLLLFPDRRAGSSMSGYRKDDYNRRYDNDDIPEDVIPSSAALENLQLDRKARNLTPSWRSTFSMPALFNLITEDPHALNKFHNDICA